MEHCYHDTKGPPAWYKMKTRPKHLPQHKLAALKSAVESIRAKHRVEMVILFGSHARDDWVEDEYEEDYITYEYRSDYDLLLVTADKKAEKRVAYDSSLKESLEAAQGSPRFNYIVHTIHHINQMLAERRFFFMDILREGYLLYDSGRYRLVRPPKALPPVLMLKHASEYFEEWMDSADGFIDSAQYNQSKGRLKIAAFEMHQATERYITCMLLVYTGYRPKEHDLEKLLRQASGIEPCYAGLFPCDSDVEKRLFDLLRRAYVDARYSKNYRIDGNELDELASRIGELRKISESLCLRKIEALQLAAGGKEYSGGYQPCTITY